MTPSQAFTVVERALGFRPEPTRSAEVEQAVRERLRQRRCGTLETYEALLSDPAVAAAERRALADRLTINESYFFRESAHHEILRSHIFHEFLERTAPPRPLEVLSVGCAAGEEPYTIALSALEAGAAAPPVRVTALDASPAAIERARAGRYSEWALRNVPLALRERHFRRVKDQYVLDAPAREHVSFVVKNVVDDDDDFWRANSYDVVFCRNLLIYLTPAVIQRTLARFHRVLRPGGYLFVAHAETGHAGTLFSVRQAEGSFYFAREAPARQAPARQAPARQAPSLERPSDGLRREPGPAARADLLAASAPPAPSAARVQEPEVLELLRGEHFDQALQLLDSDPRGENHHLLRAVALTNLGRLSEARAACDERLARLPSCAGAHYLLGLAEEQAGHARAALELHRTAARLDRLFAMPRLRAGLLARRLGDVASARALLREALDVLPHQSPRALLLFAGNFSTMTLTQLCQRELGACETGR